MFTPTYHVTRNMTIRSDELVLQFGTSLLKRVGVKGRRRIASRMRLLAGLLDTVRNLLDKPEQSFADCLDGTYFDAVVESVEVLSCAGFDEKGHRVFAKPSIVSLAGIC